MVERVGWLDEAARDWRVQATAGYVGCVSAGLDRHLGGDADRVAVVLGLSGRARARLMGWSPAIPTDVVNGFGTGGAGSRFESEPSVEPFLACADAFMALLREGVCLRAREVAEGRAAQEIEAFYGGAPAPLPDGVVPADDGELAAGDAAQW
ncbi:hypothetical protein [Yinghuangia seranimata]|uniref:hypothetical protein n=1 Tax=Yinghuangia seranimata TaxID=408067 RepID=UPI00248CF5F9|nr:hypothetical protein [Yinghuangia seranimata]MDI2126989.1 hypothetical protein [Yinghuangia seranimata]